MNLPVNREQQLSMLLGCTIEQLDISIEDFQAAEQRYQEVAKFLAEFGAHIYVQGSFMLGTVVAPYGRFGEYDLDLVCRLEFGKDTITQKNLKDRVGTLLHNYMNETVGVDDEVPSTCTDGRRCWTLDYNCFHMDVLPAITDTEAPSATAILLTDKQLRAWQHSDPLAYVDWFRRQCAKELQEERLLLEKSAAGSVDEVPLWGVRTTLHRVVQVLKRHRDVYFAGDAENKPPSSLITTLAARAYDGRRDLVPAILHAVQQMPTLIDLRNGVHWVENPVAAAENFADKWHDHPQRRLKFHQWRNAVNRDLLDALDDRGGASSVYGQLAKSFGKEPVGKALASFGDEQRRLTEVGGLKMSATGLLSASGSGLTVPKHRFFGDPAAT